MYDYSNCPVGADNEYSPWNQKDNIVKFGVSLEVSKDVELIIDNEDVNILEEFKKSDEYIHLKKILKSVNLNIDNIDIWEI